MSRVVEEVIVIEFRQSLQCVDRFRNKANRFHQTNISDYVSFLSATIIHLKTILCPASYSGTKNINMEVTSSFCSFICSFIHLIIYLFTFLYILLLNYLSLYLPLIFIIV